MTRRTKKPKKATITLLPGAMLSNVILDGCFIVIKGSEVPIIKECVFHDLYEGKSAAIEVRSRVSRTSAKKTRTR